MKIFFDKISLGLALLPIFSAVSLSLHGAGVSYFGSDAEKIVTVEGLRSDVERLCSSEFEGRAFGTVGGTKAAFCILDRFKGNNLKPCVSSFSLSEARVGRNVIAYLKGAPTSSGRPRGIVIIAAKYDGIGMLDGVLYPGADSNASGVTALMTLSDMFAEVVKNGRKYPFDILFVAVDGGQAGNAGSKALYEAFRQGEVRDPDTGEALKFSRVELFVNLDILGSTLSPLKSGREDFLMMLSDAELEQNKLALVNRNYGFNLELAYDYYGSASFTRMFFRRIGTQSVFLENGVSSVMFTSGITMRTNKVSDTPDSLNYEIFRKRLLVIFHWLSARSY